MNSTSFDDKCIDRFWKKIQKRSGCWTWTAATSAKGYGIYSVAGKTYFAHRFAWMLAHGPITDGLFACHRCDNPPCCRAECNIPGCDHGMFAEECESHLFLGTNTHNMLDMMLKKKIDKPVSRRKKRTVLSFEQIEEFRELSRCGYSQQQLADMFGVSSGYIQKRTLDIPKSNPGPKSLLARSMDGKEQTYSALPRPLTETQIAQAVEHVRNGGSPQEMADLFCVSLFNMCCYLRTAGQSYKDTPTMMALRELRP